MHCKLQARLQQGPLLSGDVSGRGLLVGSWTKYRRVSSIPRPTVVCMRVQLHTTSARRTRIVASLNEMKVQ